MRVTEIFFSIQGESTLAGEPTVFVRFTGCDLRCGYCDTEYAFYGGTAMTREQILEEVSKYPTARFVCLLSFAWTPTGRRVASKRRTAIWPRL